MPGEYFFQKIIMISKQNMAQELMNENGIQIHIYTHTYVGIQQ